MDFTIKFINEETRRAFNDTKRNMCISGGFGSGKTTLCLQKLIFLLQSFDNYRVMVGREQYKALLQTTFKTFMKYFPERFILRWNEQTGYMQLVNMSEILWMHLDAVDEASVKGLELNSGFIDQPEEVEESAYNLLDGRIGRWDQAKPCKSLLDRNNGKWPKHPLKGNYVVPAYMMLSPNPDTELHWIYLKYHPEAPSSAAFANTHSYYEVSTLDNPYADQENLQALMSRDKSWVDRYVYGKWGISDGQIHRILPESRLKVTAEWVSNLLKRANLFRLLDHGEASPTCCLWMAVYNNQVFFYREYYQPNKTIGYHRQSIADLSGDEEYSQDIADPEIFKKKSQKYGDFWTVAQEYLDTSVFSPVSGESAPTIAWQPADNNELATRNRINEMLALHKGVKHPVTSETPAPRIYFIEKDPTHGFGVSHVIQQTNGQKRKKIGELNGRPLFTDERQDQPDHAYDPFRYGIALHGADLSERPRKTQVGSFKHAQVLIREAKKMQSHQRYSYGD